MNTADSARDARSLANRRLRNLTIGTAILCIVATGSLSTLAALTDQGSAGIAAAITTADAGTTTADAGTTTADAGTTTPSAAPGSTSVAAAPVVTSVAGGTGHASTGGS